MNEQQALPSCIQSTNKNLSICHVNIQSLGTGEQGPTSPANVKLDQVRTILQIKEQFDFICLSETWLTEHIPDENIELEHYSTYRRDRGERGGGVLIYANTTFPCKRRSDLERDELELIWLEVCMKPKPIMIGVCYRPPGMNRAEATHFIDVLQESIRATLEINQDGVFLLGDFNDRCIDWTARHPNSELKEDLLDMSLAYGLEQMINEPTYVTDTSANILDLIFTNTPGTTLAAGTLPPIGTSKHAVVYCKMTKKHVRQKPYHMNVWKYEEADTEGLNVAISDMPFDDILEFEEIQNMDHTADVWTHLILETAKEYIPNHDIKINPRDKPWITKDVKHILKTRDRLYKRYQRTKEDRHYRTYCEVKYEANRKIQQAKMSYKDNLIRRLEEHRNTPQRFWKIAKEMYGKKKKESIPTLIDGNKQYCTSEQKANLLAEYYASQSQEPELPPGHNLPHYADFQILGNIEVTEAEVQNVLKKLKTDKAVGPDGVSNKLLKMTANSITPSLTKLFNAVLRSSKYPRIWKQANVTPLFKKGNRQDKGNYRPVSLISNVGKVLERLIFDKLYAYCEERNILTWRNSGYRKGDSTSNQLINIVNNTYKNLDNTEESALIFLDQSKAFDRIYHGGLMAKLESIGLYGPLLNLMNDYLHNRKICVSIDGNKSKWFRVTAGVPQGSILGPLLFLIYVNDIVDNLESEIYLYADDAVLMTNFKRRQPNTAFEQLNRDLERLTNWASDNFMSFNATKTKFMVVSNSSDDIEYPELMMNGTKLEQVHTYPQLGIHLNDRMNWDDHINHTINKASKKINIIWKLSRELPRYATENIYTSYIRPQLEYGCLVYTSCTKAQSQRLESVQRRAAIACTGAFNRTSTDRLLGELAWPTLETRRKYYGLLQMYKMANKLCPEYLIELLPPRQGYRRTNDFVPIRCRTSKYQNSFIPSGIKEWNNLSLELKTSSTISSFKGNLRKVLFLPRIKHYNLEKGPSSIHHTRMRLGLSHLRQQLHSCNIVDSPHCLNPTCIEIPETPQHYFLECPQFAAGRHRLLQVLEPIAGRLGLHTHTHLTKLILYGQNELTIRENQELFRNVQYFITTTSRF